MAKGMEDAALYVYNRLISLNEVGGEPERFGVSLPEFHRLNAESIECWPHSMLSTSTHDTKRSEDVRARIDVLSEVPAEWRAALNRWSRLTRRHRTTVDGALAPHKDDLYLIYQTLVGTWPLAGDPNPTYVERIQAYTTKALREAAMRTNWLNPNEGYEAALNGFIAGILDPRAGKPFRDDFTAFHARLVDAGLVNALGQQLLKLTAPGVPDIYQGTELWNDSLVDPDNRRPVDFAQREVIARALDGSCPSVEHAAELWARRADGRLKLAVTQRTLATRRAVPALFAEGDYHPLPVSGGAAKHVVAFARRHGDDEAIAVVPRLVAGLAGAEISRLLGSEAWADTRVELSANDAGAYRDVFTGEWHHTVAEDGQSPVLDLGTILT